MAETMSVDDYLNDPLNDTINFNIARWYEQQGHISPAISFYIRAADLTDNIDLRYESLLRVASCYKKAENRDITYETTLKQAIALDSEKPQAYALLAQHYEDKKDYINSYLFSSLGITKLNNKFSLIINDEYPGYYLLYFLRACSLWQIGKPDDSRKAYKHILDNFLQDLNPFFKKLLQNNLMNLGSGSENEAFVLYDKSKHKLKHSFNNCEKIKQNYSQVLQDIAVLTLLDGKKNGTYLEIGSAKPFHGNNTALLEQDYDWKGVGIDFNENFVNDYKNSRKNKVLCEDALKVDYEEILQEISPNSNIIDYLQLDIEPSKNTFAALALLPLEKYQFRFITYEHDHAIDVYKCCREKSRKYLEMFGYKLLINDIGPNINYPFEDWYYHPDLVDKERVDMLKNVDLTKNHIVDPIFFL